MIYLETPVDVSDKSKKLGIEDLDDLIDEGDYLPIDVSERRNKLVSLK